jgi:RimJ/RimL family protein N-acetyltransferase
MIQGQKVRLRAIERGDIPRFLKWLNDPSVTDYLELYLPISQAQEERWFERQLEDELNMVFAIETHEARHIGNIGLHRIEWKDRSAVLGIFIGEREVWGQGYGTDAVRTLLRLAFHEMGLHRVSLHVFDHNRRAIRCYEKSGFREEGRLREAHFAEGRFHDVLVMGILDREFSWPEGHSEEGAP